MNDGSLYSLRTLALDSTASDSDRMQAVEALAELRSAGAVDALLELAGRRSEPESLLRKAGGLLARLADDGLVSQWDVRDLADPADDAFYD